MDMDPISLKRMARQAGLLYLVWILTGFFGIFYVPSQITMRGDAASTAQSILSHETLFRASIVNDLVSSALWILIGLVLYRLFKSTNEHYSRMLVALVLVQIPATFVMDACSLTSLLLFRGEILTTLEPSQRQEWGMLFLNVNDTMTWSLELYWGLWLVPLAVLTYRSRFLPRIVGVWLAVDGLAYVILCFVTMLAPHYKDLVMKISYPAMMGEMAFMLWLVLKGAQPRQRENSSQPVPESWAV